MQIAIVLYPGMTTLDAIGPYEVLRFLPDSELRFVSHEPGPIVTDSGVLVLGATHSYAETPGPDIVLVPGSEANTLTAMADDELLQWLKQVHQTSRFTLSVCSGALILAAAGILKGHPAITHWIARDMLPTFGVVPQRDKRIVQSGKIITGAGVTAGLDLALFVMGELYGRERAEITQLLIEYDPQPPFQAGHPTKASKVVFEAARAEMLARAKNRRNALSMPIILWRNTISTVRDRLGFPSSLGRRRARRAALELKIPPLVLLGICAAVLWSAAMLLPELSLRFPGKPIAASLSAVIGAVVSVAGVVAFRRAHTTVDPRYPEKSTALVSHGIYRVSRNPMYLGFLLLLAAWAVHTSNIVGLISLLAFILYMNRFQIVPEERILRANFGNSFVEYERSVRRWL